MAKAVTTKIKEAPKDAPPNRAIGLVEVTLVSNYDEALEGLVSFVIRKITQGDRKG